MRLAEGCETGGRLIGVEPNKPVGSELEALDNFENWIGQLPRLQAKAFRHIYLDGKTQKETADLVGCSKWCLNRMHSQGLSRCNRLASSRLRTLRQKQKTEHETLSSVLRRSRRPVGFSRRVGEFVDELADRAHDITLLGIAQLRVNGQGDGFAGGRLGVWEVAGFMPSEEKQTCKCSGIG